MHREDIFLGRVSSQEKSLLRECASLGEWSTKGSLHVYCLVEVFITVCSFLVLY